MAKKYIAIIGHSYVRKLGEFVEKHKSYANLRLNKRFVVEFYGRGGATASGRKRFFQSIADYRMASGIDVVFIHLGENDFRYGVDPLEVAEQLFQSARNFVEHHHVKKVVISELLPFPKCDRDWIIGANFHLSQLVAGCEKIHLWKQKKSFWSKSQRMYNSDGVHVHPRKMHVYAQAIRFSIMNACRSLEA